MQTNNFIEVDQHDDQQRGWKESIQSIAIDQQYSLLVDKLRSLIAKILGLAPTMRIELRQGLKELGMDSITSMEMRSQLEKVLETALPATLLFDYPTLETLANYLGKTVFAFADAESNITEDLLLDDDLSAFLLDIEQIADSDIEEQLACTK
jgi:myxalamid-type polyketide synthase MxaB